MQLETGVIHLTDEQSEAWETKPYQFLHKQWAALAEPFSTHFMLSQSYWTKEGDVKWK